jgi:hypothetical protein
METVTIIFGWWPLPGNPPKIKTPVTQGDFAMGTCAVFSANAIAACQGLLTPSLVI